MEEQKKKKKIASKIVDVVLGALIVLILGLQIDMFITKNNNFGIPSLFGYSFMEVLTDSMEGENPDSFDAGEGVVIQKRDVNEVKAGEVITFYSEQIQYCVSHRVIEIVISPDSVSTPGKFEVSSAFEYSVDNGTTWTTGGEQVSLEAGKNFMTRSKSDTEHVLSHTMPNYSGKAEMTFYTCGDNLNAEFYVKATGKAVESTYRDVVPSKYYVGSVMSHSHFFGGVLHTVQSIWFVPVAILVPILIIGTMTVIDFIKGYREEKRKEEEELNNEMLLAGVDPKDEKAVLIFKEKYQMRKEIEREMEEMKKEQKALFMEEFKKAKEELAKSEELERIKAEEKARILAEYAKEGEVK